MMISCFRLFSSIPQVINEIELDYAAGILIVPLFTIETWFTRQLRLQIQIFLCRSRNLSDISKFLLIACHVSGKCINRNEFHQEL